MAKEEVIGSPRRNLVFETSGVIRVKVGDKYYKLNYNKETTNNEDEESIESKIITVDDIALYETGQYEYPGDGKIIFAFNGGIYYTLDNSYFNFNDSQNSDILLEQDTIFDNTVIFNGNPPFKLNSLDVINNLNAQFIEGHNWNDIQSLLNNKSASFDVLETTDGKFKAEDGKVTCNTIVCDNANIKNLSFDNLSGNITVGGNVNVIDHELYINGKLCDFGVNVLQILYKLYSVKGVDTNKTTFVEFAKDLVKSINTNYNWQTPSTYTSHQYDFDKQILSESFYWEPINIESWKNILCIPLSTAENYYIDPEEISEDIEVTENAENIKRSSNLYNEIMTKIYIIPEERKPIFHGDVLKLSIDSGFVVPGTEGELIISEYNKNISDEPNVTKTKFIVTGINNNELYIHTLYNSNKASFLELISESVDLYEYVENTESITYNSSDETLPFITINTQYYSEPSQDSEYYNIALDINPESINFYNTNTTIIGNLSIVSDNILNPSGIGIYSDNCYLNNPTICLYNKTEQKNYIKFSITDRSFIGINDVQDNWIKIDNVGNGSIITSTYTLKSNGELNIGEWLNVEKISIGLNDLVRCSLKRGDMYSIDNYNSFCKFGPLVIQEDGSATLGSGETQITISASGEVKIPSAAIIE